MAKNNEVRDLSRIQTQNLAQKTSQKLTQNLARILYLAINEREKSLKFYESLCDSWVDLGDSNKNLDESLREIFTTIVQKEREILENTKMIFSDLCGKSTPKNALKQVLENKSILLPSALPENILQELQNEMGAVDLKSLNILALGVESHHLKSCDFLIKKAQNLGNSQDSKAQDSRTIDILYQLQALSYNHHIPLLQGESLKENANPNSVNPTNLPQITLQDLLNQSPLFSEIKSAFDSFQNLYNQTKIIVAKLEKGELSQDELVAFLQKLRF